MRAGVEGEVAACDSIARASVGLPLVGDVAEQAVATSAVTSAADTTVLVATKCFDIGVQSSETMPRILRGLPRHAPDGHGEQNPTCDQRQAAKWRQHVDETRGS